MKALSIKQPWLYCITNLDKRVGNRTWKPPVWALGTTIALHASKKKDNKIGIREATHLAGVDLVEVVMPLGAIVGTAVLAGYVTEETIPAKDKWFFGPFGWVLDDVELLNWPVPCRGFLGLWQVEEVVEAKMWPVGQLLLQLGLNV